MEKFFGKNVDVVNAENKNIVSLKYRVNAFNVIKLMPFIFVGLCLTIHIVLIIKKLVLVF